MATNQEGRHAAVRAITGTASDYNSDFLSLFALSGFITGTFNERFLLWINSVLGTTYTSLPGAMQAYAVEQGFNNWNSLNTIVAIEAPVLEWVSDENTALPVFYVDFDETAVEVGAVITLQIATDSSFVAIVQTLTDTLDSGEKDAGAITPTAAELISGTYYARAKITGSPWSNTVTKTLDISQGGWDVNFWWR